MSYFYAQRTVSEDRDLSRAAAERHLQLQAVSERPRAEPRRLNRLLARLTGPKPASRRRTQRLGLAD